MVNPNGNDDEAFDLNSLMNRHNQVVHLGTHALWHCRPQMDSTILLQIPQQTAVDIEQMQRNVSKEQEIMSPFSSLFM